MKLTDAIVAEIEARGLFYQLQVDRHKDTRSVKGDCRAVVFRVVAWDQTAPLALCASLVATLKENP